MSRFEPIAIVGRGCMVPGAPNPDALLRLVLEKRSALTAVPEGLWLVDESLRNSAHGGPASRVGGYVPEVDLGATLRNLAISEREVLAMDVSFQWALEAARQALSSTGHDAARVHARGGVVLGNLSYPTLSLSLLAQPDLRADRAAARRPVPDARARFMSGLPAHLLARAFGLGYPAFALDAACASSLYAVKLACDRLHDRECDFMLAGGLNGADDLFLHVGFTALNALSPTGRSRPFHRDADGLIPAQGAAFVALERLEDARAAGHRVFGVIRGVSVANDGRSQGLLVPSRKGQLQTMSAAYPMAGLSPADISLVECHATGTRRGDETEILAMRELFRDVDRPVGIGSIKGNIGHLITASGVTSLIKILGSFDSGTLPPTLHDGLPLEALNGSGLRLVTEPEHWAVRPRRAAINNFGFGGNNAHLIVEEPDATEVRVSRRMPVMPEVTEVAVVGVSVITGGAEDYEAFADLVLGRTEPRHRPLDAIELDPTAVRFPPNDLRETLPQQLLVLSAAMQLADVITAQDRVRTGVVVGMQCDTEGAGVGARFRMPEGPDGFFPSPSAALVLGTMPNVVANRIGNQFDLSGPSFTVSAEEASGLIAVELAMRALDAGEIDAVVVGAVDLCCEPVHRAAAADVLGDKAEPAGDAAVVLVMKRAADARRDANHIHGILSRRPPADIGISLGTAPDALPLTARFGHAHAASGLLHLAAALACCERRLRPTSVASEPWLPNGGLWGARVAMASLGGPTADIFVRADITTASVATISEPRPQLEVYSAPNRADLIRHISAGEHDNGHGGPVRLALAISDDRDAERVRTRAVAALRTAEKSASFAALGDGIYFAEQPLGGEVAFMFTGPAGAYPGMGRDLMQAFPELIDRMQSRFPNLRQAAGWLYESPTCEGSPEDKVWGSGFLSQMHAELTRNVLGIRPDAVLGFCSGESNALFAMDVWDDLASMYDAIRSHEVFTRELAGEFASVSRARGGGAVDWSTWRILAPVDAVRERVAEEPNVHVAIIQTGDEVIICGDAAGCRRVVTSIGETRARRVSYDVAIHCPEMRSFAPTWRALHRRPVRPLPGVRFYSHARCEAYELSAESVADALTTQAMQTVDFPRLIERAANDGVRIFIEHGQHAGCSKWIDRILGDRPHLAVPLDVAGRSSLTQAVDAVARLVVAGVPMNVGAFQAALARILPGRPVKRAALTFPAHWSALRAATQQIAEEEGELMEPPPSWSLHQAASLEPSVASNFSDGSMRQHDNVSAPDAGGWSPAVGAAHSLLASMNEQHRRFLQIQAAAHDEFLSAQSQATAVLVGAYAGELRTAVAPSPLSGGSRLAPVTNVPVEAAPVRARTPVVRPRTPRGPQLNREQLMAHAAGRLSDAFGVEFRDHDGYVLRVRMPEPPLLLADRVTGLEAEAGSMGLGTVWTETDVREDSWYLHAGRMPSGILLEAGQADLLLISYLGVDRLNRGMRAYRLLGCDLTYHHRLPRPDITLSYDIHVDGHADHEGVRLFFFHSDGCADGVRYLSVRNAQAGFFSREELDNARGVLWRPEEATPTPGGRCDPPAIAAQSGSFDRAHVRAFAEGRPHECFGPALVRTRAHTRTPRIASDRMLLIDEVTAFDPKGGPWGRGYLRAVLHIDPNRWFFDGHFTNDPCMPGTLMFEACLQAMAFYLTALGYTIPRDGWVFEPVLEQPMRLVCRGQVVPDSIELACELFVDEVIDGPEPTLYAAMLGTVDGQPALHSPRLGLSLRPAWPIDDDFARLTQLAQYREPKPVADIDGFPLDYRSLVHCAIGKPSDSFGEMYRVMDGPAFLGRLPGPPYHFMSRVVHVDGRPGGREGGIAAIVEYDVPGQSWYFDAGEGTMPYAVLLEIGLQPCGWLSFYAGLPLSRDCALYFRNLDGRSTVHRVVRPGEGPLRTETRLTSVAAAGGVILVNFTVSILLGGERIFDAETSFGFFDAEALSRQTGLPTTDAQVHALGLSNGYSDRITARAQSVGHQPQMSMLDEVTGLWPDGGKAGLGRAQARQRVDPDAWYFKAHFFRDPVQPGSLGLQALLQLLEYLADRREPTRSRSRVESPAVGEQMVWKYRGQVLPESGEMVVEVEIIRVVAEGRSTLIVADGSLWVDGTRIYEAFGLSTRTWSA